MVVHVLERTFHEGANGDGLSLVRVCRAIFVRGSLGEGKRTSELKVLWCKLKLIDHTLASGLVMDFTVR